MTQLSVNNPFLEWLGVSLSAWSPGYAEMRLPTSPSLGNLTGRLQGGVICTLLDAAAGYSGLYSPVGEPPLRSVSLSLTTHFMDSGKGDALVAKGYVQRKGRGIYFARGEVWMDETLLLATAMGTFKYISVA